MLTFKAGTVRCFALQSVFKQHPGSFLIKHENPSREHADPAVPALFFAQLKCTFHPQMVVTVNHIKAKLKLPFIKYVAVNLWHVNETRSQADVGYLLCLLFE